MSSSLAITSIVTESNSFRINFVAGSPPAGAHTNSVTLFVNEKNSSDSEFPVYTLFESSIAAEDDIPSEFLIELEDPPQFNVGATYVMSISQSFSDGSETVSNTMEEDYVLNAKPLQPVIYDVAGSNIASGDQVVSFYLDTGASQGSAVLSITGRSFNVAAGQYVTHQCPINASTLTRDGSSGTNMKVRKTISGDPEFDDNLYYCVLLNLENGVLYEHRFSTINAVGKSESCDVFTSTPTNEVLAVPGFALDSSILDYKFTAAWNELVIPNHDDFESIVTGYQLDYEYTDASYNLVMATFDASSNTLEFESQPLQVAEAASGVSVVNGTVTSLTSVQMTLAKADSTPALITVETDEDGWTIDNADGVADASGNFPKVNLYFYGNTVAAASQTVSNSFTLNDATDLGLYAIFDQAAGAMEYPFFNAYTTFSGTNNRSWYKSKVFYGAQSNTGNTINDPALVGLTLAYTGTDDTTLFPHIPSARRIQYEVKVGAGLSDVNSGYASEFMQYLTLQTSSQAVSADNYNFRLLETGMFTSHASFGQLRLLYNLTGKVNATIFATTNNSGVGALSAVKSIRVFDNPKCLCSQDYDYTITTDNQEIIVNIALDADALAYLSNRSELTHIVIGVRDASYNSVPGQVDVSYNIIDNALNLNHSFTELANGVPYIIRMQLVALNPNPLENDEVIYGDVENVPDIVPLANADAISVTATGSDETVTFDWSVVTDAQLQGGAFVKYVIKYQSGAVIHDETNINTTSYQLTGLTNGTTYYFTFYVVTLNPNTGSDVNGDPTDLSQIPFKAADAPASITLTPGDGQMMVDWPGAQMNGSVFQYYRVELFSGAVGSGSSVTSADVYDASTFTFTGLTNGTSYYATVTVNTTDPNDSAISYNSFPVTSSSKIPFQVPNAPASVTLTPGDEQMQVGWSTAVLNGSGFTEYLVELFPGSHSTTVTTQSTLTHTFTGLTNGTSYYARVTVYARDPNDSAIVISGGSTYSLSKTPFTYADAPTLAPSPGYQTLQVDWSNVQLNGGVFVNYTVQLYDSSGTVLMPPEVVYTNQIQDTHTFTGLTIGVNYTMKVIVVTSDPNGTNLIDGSAGSITASPHDNPIIIGSATINNSTKTVSVTVDKNGSNITDYMAIVQTGNYMQKINDSEPVANGDGTYTLSVSFNDPVLYPSLFSSNISSVLMVVGNGRGFTAVEFNGSTQTVLSPEHYRAALP